MGMPRFAVSSISLCLLTARAWTEAPPPSLPAPPAEESEQLDEVLVSGVYPGPGLWKITRAEDVTGHALWIVGEPPPLPKRMTWKSQDIEAVALASQEILLDSSVRLNTDEKIGFFRGVTLLPAALEARRNPDDAKLDEVLPPDLYARWLVQKKLYLGHESGVESWRPLFASQRLLKAALKDLDLREGGVVWDVLEELAREHKIKVTRPAKNLVFKRTDVRTKLKEFSRESLQDVECFGTTLSLAEALADTETQKARARAWA